MFIFVSGIAQLTCGSRVLELSDRSVQREEGFQVGLDNYTVLLLGWCKPGVCSKTFLIRMSFCENPQNGRNFKNKGPNNFKIKLSLEIDTRN